MKALIATALLAAALAAHAQSGQPVGPSAKLCKDLTMYPNQPERYEYVEIYVGTTEYAQTCVEVLDTQQGDVCRVAFICKEAT